MSATLVQKLVLTAIWGQSYFLTSMCKLTAICARYHLTGAYELASCSYSSAGRGVQVFAVGLGSAEQGRRFAQLLGFPQELLFAGAKQSP